MSEVRPSKCAKLEAAREDLADLRNYKADLTKELKKFKYYDAACERRAIFGPSAENQIPT